jgi:maltooligosyltrehalose trehalohydrolase
MSPILATDLDGTLVPGDGIPPDDPQQLALQTLRQLATDRRLEIIFVTGRHHDSVMSLMAAKGLPRPQWIICDVGTSLFQGNPAAEQPPYRLVQAYVNHLDQIVGSFSAVQLAQCICVSDDLRLQEAEKQGRHKLSYYCDAGSLDRHVDSIEQQLERSGAPYRIVSSIDPFNGDGLIDLLPGGTDKASALLWLADFRRCERESIVFAGDSGNDYAALTAGFRAILVGNADRKLAERLIEHHRQAGHKDRLYLAQTQFTAGVLEGCRWFGVVPKEL